MRLLIPSSGAARNLFANKPDWNVVDNSVILEVGEVLHPACGLIPLAALALLVYLCVRYTRFEGPLPRSSYAWVLPSALILLFVSIWGFLGMVEGSAVLMAFISVGIALSGWFVLWRERAFAYWNRRIHAANVKHRRKQALITGLILLGASASAYLASEAGWNSFLFIKWPTNLILSLVITWCILAALYFIAQRRGVAVAVGIVIFAVIGVAQFYVGRFKETAILPSDLLALGTAAAVSGGYDYSITQHVYLGFLFASIGIMLAAFLRKPACVSVHSHLVACNVGASIALVVVLTLGCVFIPFSEAFGLDIRYWRTLNSYQSYGILPAFISAAQDLALTAPDGYTAEEAESIQEEYAAAYDEIIGSSEQRAEAESSFAEEQPTVIAIMNESFTDLSFMDELDAGYTGPDYFQEVSEASVLAGQLAVSVYGAGTCNTEFEFLTNNTIAFMGSGKYPYMTYDLSDTESIAHQFKELGYVTTAIHPQLASNWNRDIVYEDLGFDTFLSIDDFAEDVDSQEIAHELTDTSAISGVDTFHSGVTDKETYKKILELLEQDDSPQFIFDVTMQNHGGYDQDNIPVNVLTSYEPESFDDSSHNAKLNEYLSCIEASDRDLEYLIEALSELDRPVVVVFFGDHQPSCSWFYNDSIYIDDDETTHQERIYQSDYFIWANYDLSDSSFASGSTSVNSATLSALVMNAIGAPLTDHQKTLLATQNEIAAFNAYGYQTTDGVWHALDEETSVSSVLTDLSFVEFLNFGEDID